MIAVNGVARSDVGVMVGNENDSSGLMRSELMIWTRLRSSWVNSVGAGWDDGRAR